MGCNCTKSTTTAVAKGNKISEIRSNVISVQKSKGGVSKMSVNSGVNLRSSLKFAMSIHRNYFYVIQRKTWLVILDFLPYKDLCQAGHLNKFLNKAAKNQFLLQKFYKKRKNLSDGNILKGEGLTVINNSQNISNHYNYTTINNFSSVGDILPLDLKKYLNLNNFNINNCELNGTRHNSEINGREMSTLLTPTLQEKLKEVPSFNEKKENTSGVCLNHNGTGEFNSSFVSVRSPNSHRRRKGSSHSRNSESEKEVKKVNKNPYIDLFSKKEIEFSNSNSNINLNAKTNSIYNYRHGRKTSSGHSFHYNSSECGQSYRSSIHSADVTNRTPSFSEVILNQSEDGSIEIVSIREYSNGVLAAVCDGSSKNNNVLRVGSGGLSNQKFRSSLINKDTSYLHNLNNNKLLTSSGERKSSKFKSARGNNNKDSHGNLKYKVFSGELPFIKSVALHE